MNNINSLKPNIIIGENYSGIITLDAWNGFQSKQHYNNSKNSGNKSDGVINVFVKGKSVDYVTITTVEQVNAVQYLIENSEKIKIALLTCLNNDLHKLRKTNIDSIPQVNEIDDFKNSISLSALHIMDSDKDDFAYVGFEFNCDWDKEHGIGIMMHKDKVIDVGQAETAIKVYDDNCNPR
jgi:hypothetical protein